MWKGLRKVQNLKKTNNLVQHLFGEEKNGYFDGMKSLGFNFFNLSYHAIKTILIQINLCYD